MYTHDIILEEVAAATFDKMKDYWNLAGFNTRDDSVQARILNPLTWPVLEDKIETYCQFIEFLLQHHWLDQINVKSREGWVKHYARKIKKEDIKTFATIAATTPFRRNYLDILFKEPGINEHVERAHLEFREYEFAPHDLRIVSYQATVFPDYTHLFNVFLQEQDFFQIQGLWVPEEGRKVRVNTDTGGIVP